MGTARSAPVGRYYGGLRWLVKQPQEEIHGDDCRG